MMWMVRAGEYGEESHAAWKKSVVTIGWIDLPDLSYKDRGEIRDLFDEYYSDYYPYYPKSVPNWVGYVYAFVRLIRIGDLVVLPCKLENSIVVGRVLSDYTYKDLGQDIIHWRRAEWLTSLIPKTQLPADTKKYFGLPPTVYKLNPITEPVVAGLISDYAQK